ncbi:MAG TPA: AIR synthase related protein [Bdellovibrionales bacterium]|nr:AIR synthase related protein [Bdellovibrionales bacterium]
MPLKPDRLPEMAELAAWLGRYKRPPRQLNTLNSADCELIRLSKKETLAITVDTLSDEMDVGLYAEPETAGWMTAVVSLSDLSAVGADPLGLLVSNTWGEGVSLDYKKAYARGLHASLRKNRAALLGGDSGSGRASVHSAVGVGLVKGKVIQRVPIKPGAILAHAGRVGLGPALGFKLLLQKREAALRESDFRPVPRLREGRALKELATALMDTSDGFMTTVYNLAVLNGVGFELDWNEKLIDPKAAAFCREAGLPLSSLLFGEHGDYQLLAAIPPRLWSRAKARVPSLIPVGRAVPAKRGFSMSAGTGPRFSLPLTEVQSLPRKALVDILKAFETVVEFLRKTGAP